METELWLEIRRLHFREKIPKKAIARKLSVDIKTVRRAIRSKEPPGTRQHRRRPSILDPYKGRVRAILSEYPDLSAVRIQEKIRKDGYPGGITIVRQYVAKLKKKSRRAFLRLSFPPGDAAQVDWGHCGTIVEQGVHRRLSVFAMTLCHSRMLFAEFTFSQSLDELLRCHQDAFRFFGGVPSRVLYDNMRTVVLSRAEDRVRFHPRFLDFAAHYLLKPVLCRPGEPQEKGRVERAIGYIKGSFLAGRSLGSLMEVNQRSAALSEAVLAARPSLRAFAEGSPHWRSPLTADDYREFQDAAFLRCLGLGQHRERLRSFWPRGGPVWDGLAIVRGRAGSAGVLIVEAKSHAAEMESHCKAKAESSRTLIDTSLSLTRQFLGAAPETDWTTPYYQYANRLAHLYFLSQACAVPTWLVFVYFVGDTEMGGPGSREEWQPQIEQVKTTLGIPGDHALADRCVDVFLPATPEE